MKSMSSSTAWPYSRARNVASAAPYACAAARDATRGAGRASVRGSAGAAGAGTEAVGARASTSARVFLFSSSAASRRVASFAGASRAARTPSASSRECVASASSSARARATSRAASSWEAWLAAIWVRRVATSLWSRFTVPRVAQPVARTARTAVAPKTRFIRGDASTRSKAKSTAGRVRGAGLEPAEHDHLHRPARGDFRVGCDDGEAVGEHHRAQDARALIAGEPRAVALGVARESDAQVSPPRAAVGDRRERPRDDAGPRDDRAPEHAPEGRPHEQLEGHHGGHGIAGEPEDRTAAERAKGDRLAGAHRDLPQVELGATPLQRGAHQIELAHGDTRRGDEDVGRAGPPEALDDRLEAVGHDPQVYRLGAGLQRLG